ncbi:MAG TPA: transposase [Oligoflexus sp.]|uniref:transposase n=1 Tax=Oligoflexus sp. TaxID=1971216 RepID=UPI002D73D05A|nr:transposase [Oligoflexus sp.]HYX37259.1 transposase [Oligoflexus sp.]
MSYRLLKGLIRVQNLICGFNALSTFAPSSLSDARKKLPPYLFVDLPQWIYRFLATKFKHEKWFGRDIFAMDATKIILPKQLEKEGFDDMGSGCYYPLAMITGLYDVRLGLVYDSVVSQHADEQLAAEALIPSMRDGSLVIFDRGYFSYRLIQVLSEAKVDFIIRLSKASAPVELREFFEKQNQNDEIVSISPSEPSERKILRQGRLVRYLSKSL